MVLYQLKCPGCNAVLDVDDGTIDVMYCKYCGSKILLDGQSDNVVNAKADVIKHRESTQSKERIKLAKIEQEKEENKHDTIVIIALLLTAFLVVLCMFLVAWIS